METESQRLKQQLKLIQEVVSIESYNLGEQFFKTIVSHLNQVLEADYTFIGKLSQTGEQVETISMASKQGLMANFTYNLKNTPCENVIGHQACCYRKDITELFPQDQLLIDMGIQGYAGVPLFDAYKQPAGILVCLYVNEINESLEPEMMLSIFASRISAELEHMKLRESLEISKRQLEEKVALEQAKKEDLIKAISERDSFRDALNDSSLISITNLQGTIIFANDKFIEVSKYNQDELIGANHNILNSGHHPKEFWVEMWKAIAQGHPWRHEVKNKAKDGSYYWVDTTICPIRDSEGKIKQFLSIRNLITERKSLQEHREKLLGDFKEFAFLTSHVIRAPLARMLGLLTLINEEDPEQVNNQKALLEALSIAS